MRMRNDVALCTTRSIPASSGRWLMGAAMVLSQTVIIARDGASAPTAARSVSASSGNNWLRSCIPNFT